MAVAGRFGVVADEPIVLSDSNSLVVWLAPTPLVAEVGTGHHGRLAHEFAVAEHLRAVGAPIVPPSDAVPLRVHACDGFNVTFWEYHRRQDDEIDPRQWADALFELHEGLTTYDGDLPSFRAELDAVQELLADAGPVRALDKATGRCW